jgi:hypothetical protein
MAHRSTAVFQLDFRAAGDAFQMFSPRVSRAGFRQKAAAHARYAAAQQLSATVASAAAAYRSLT